MINTETIEAFFENHEVEVRVLDLNMQELKRKLILLTPKSHEPQYLDKVGKDFVV